MFDINCTTKKENMLPNFSIKNVEIIPMSYPNAGVIFEIESVEKDICCCSCGSKHVHIHEYHSKTIHGGSFNETPVWYKISHRRMVCNDCNITFMERFESLPLYARKLMDVEYAIIHTMAGRTIDDVSESYGISPATIYRMLEKYAESEQPLRLKGSYRYLSMDEIFYKRTSEGTPLYYWVLNDISDYNKVNTIKIEMGRNKEEVIKRLKELSNPDRVKAVCIDMWRPYADAIKEVLPNAFIVIDGFHVLQLAEREFEILRKRLGETTKQKKSLKTDAKLLTTNLFKLKDEELDKIEYYLKLYPEFEKAYFLHQELYEFYQLRDYEHALEYIANWSSEVLESGVQELKNVLNTIENWLPYIMNKFIFRISNGKTEGRNNLIRTMLRQGFHYGLVTLRAKIYSHDDRLNKRVWVLKQKKRTKDSEVIQIA